MNNFKIVVFGNFGRIHGLLFCQIWFFSCTASYSG